MSLLLPCRLTLSSAPRRSGCLRHSESRGAETHPPVNLAIRMNSSKSSTSCASALTSRGDVLIAEGTVGDDFFILVSGKVEVVRPGQLLITLSPGAPLGRQRCWNAPNVRRRFGPWSRPKRCSSVATFLCCARTRASCGCKLLRSFVLAMHQRSVPRACLIEAWRPRRQSQEIFVPSACDTDLTRTGAPSNGRSSHRRRPSPRRWPPNFSLYGLSIRLYHIFLPEVQSAAESSFDMSSQSRRV